MFQSSAFQSSAFQSSAVAVIAHNGGSPHREYKPTHYELVHRLELEKKLQATTLDIVDNSREIERLELKRLRDLADEDMQRELIFLLSEQQRLELLLAELQQAKLIRMRNEDDMLIVLMCTNFN